MKELMFGISGVRGVVGESLTPGVVSRLGKAFGTFIYKSIRKSTSKARGLKVVVGRDGRSSGERLKKSFIEGMVSTGLDVIDMGELATPVLLFNVVKTKSRGGAIITASHNSPEWNGVKFAGPRGIFISADEVDEIYRIYKTSSFTKGISGKLLTDTHGEKRHIMVIVDSVNRDAIRSREFKIVIDSPWFGEISRLLRSIGCAVFEVTVKGRGNTPPPLRTLPPRDDKTLSVTRGFEPLPENLVDLSRVVISTKADIGFATDADGDRLSIVTECGEALDSEYTLPLVANWVLKRRRGLVVTNLSTSKMIEDVAVRNGSKLKRTRVGEINVVESMLEGGAVLGGEGNGGIIDPFIHYTRDSFVGMCRILESMAASGESISRLADYLPKYYMKKEKITDYRLQITDLDFIVNLFPGSKINREDGVRIDFAGGWVHVRKSNTEPIIRLICETKDKSLTDSLIDKVLKEAKRCAV